MASSSLNINNVPPPGFKWILVCNNCIYCYCFDCLSCRIRSIPTCINILNKWVQTYNHCISYLGYLRMSHNMARGSIPGGPMQGQIYILLYTPCITYEDYCKIRLQAKYEGSCWIIFECSMFKESQIWWFDGYIFYSGLTVLEMFSSLAVARMLSNNGLEQKLKKLLITKDGSFSTYHSKEVS